MVSIERASLRNRLLAALPDEIFVRLREHLHRVDMPLRAVLNKPNEPITSVLFPEIGYGSVLAVLEDGDATEVGMIGSEGMVGLPLLFGTDRAPTETIVQGPGFCHRLDADVFRRALEAYPVLRTLLLRYAMAFNVQIAMTAACNGRHHVEQRLARWLLMAHDRSEGDEFPMTHEFLSLMLGVRRAGVTVAAGMLQKAGYIKYEQGFICVADRPGLEAAACECHGVVRREFQRLLGPAAQG
jgi:CRP-like cAMP-binding protein